MRLARQGREGEEAGGRADGRTGGQVQKEGVASNMQSVDRSARNELSEKHAGWLASCKDKRERDETRRVSTQLRPLCSR